jgi:hypothetical protein
LGLLVVTMTAASTTEMDVDRTNLWRDFLDPVAA